MLRIPHGAEVNKSLVTFSLAVSGVWDGCKPDWKGFKWQKAKFNTEQDTKSVTKV